MITTHQVLQVQRHQMYVTRRRLPEPWFDFWIWDIRNRVGESPVWDAAQQKLVWIDVRGQEVLRLDPSTQQLERWALPDVVGAVAMVGINKVIVALRHQLAYLDLAACTLELLEPLANEPRTNRLNEGKFSPSGKWFVFGSMDDRPSAKQPTGRFYRAGPDGAVLALTDGLHIANGLAWAPDGNSIYFSDSYTGIIYRADWDEPQGSMGAPRVWVHSDESAGRPDGALVGIGGAYLSAGVSAGCLNTFKQDGLHVGKLNLPLRAPTMPCLGGANDTRLFITSLSRPEWNLADGLDGFLLETAPPAWALQAT